MRGLLSETVNHKFSAEGIALWVPTLVRQEGYEVVAVRRTSIEMGPFTILQSILNSIVGNNNYLFKFLKSRELRASNSGSAWRTAASLALLPIVGPISLVVYFGLLAVGSGDIFVLYCRRVGRVN